MKQEFFIIHTQWVSMRKEKGTDMQMQIITTHTNMDFDALASVVACTFLYPEARGILPSHMAPEVKAFLSVHQDLFKVLPRKGFDERPVESLIVVDANTWHRLDRMDYLSRKKPLHIICWDHHMQGSTIIADEEHREEVGATITLLLEEMQRRDTAFSPMHATLFLLGIYDDTGCLCFSSATARDAHMVGYLLENGADLNIVSAYLNNTVDEAHAEVFSSMLSSAQTFDLEGLKVGLCLQPVKSGLTMLANLVSRYKEFKGLDVALGVFPTDLGKCMVIGRSSPRGIDIGYVMRKIGGGGHAGAGSAVIKDAVPEELAATIMDHVRNAVQKGESVGDIMSRPEAFTATSDMTMAQARKILSQRQINALMICEKGRFLGTLSALDVAKAERSHRLETSVKGYMKRNIPKLSPQQNARQALELMNQSSDGVLPVVDADRLVGVMTRGNLILEIYDI